MFKRIVSAALIFGAAALAPPAHAQSRTNCLDREKMVQSLETRYNESLKSIGMQSPTQLLEIWSSEDSGTFTVLITSADGTSCVVAFGQNWQAVEVENVKAGTAS